MSLLPPGQGGQHQQARLCGIHRQAGRQRGQREAEQCGGDLQRPGGAAGVLRQNGLPGQWPRLGLCALPALFPGGGQRRVPKRVAGWEPDPGGDRGLSDHHPAPPGPGLPPAGNRHAAALLLPAQHQRPDVCQAGAGHRLWRHGSKYLRWGHRPAVVRAGQDQRVPQNHPLLPQPRRQRAAGYPAGLLPVRWDPWKNSAWLRLVVQRQQDRHGGPDDLPGQPGAAGQLCGDAHRLPLLPQLRPPRLLPPHSVQSDWQVGGERGVPQPGRLPEENCGGYLLQQRRPVLRTVSYDERIDSCGIPAEPPAVCGRKSPNWWMSLASSFASWAQATWFCSRSRATPAGAS